MHNSPYSVSMGRKLCMACLSAFAVFQAAASGVAPSVEKASSPDEKVLFINQFNKAKIVPERIRTFAMPVPGYVNNWLMDSDRADQDTIIATVNEEDMALKRKELEINILKDKIAKREELAKLEKQLEEIRFYQNLNKQERRWIDKKEQTDDQTVQSVEDKISLTRQELEIVEEKPRRDLAKEEESYILKMPFPGKLQYHFSFPGDQSQKVYLEANTPIATVCDDSAYYIAIPIADPELIQLDPATLRAQVSLTNGHIMTGTFSYKRMEKNSSSGGEMLVFFFKLPPELNQQSYNMLGSNCVAKLYFMPSEPVICLNKMDLASRPEVKLCTTWEQALQKIHPEYELILDAESQLIVRKK